MKTKNKEQFFELIYRFLNGESIYEDFCNSFVSLWIKDRDKTLAKKRDWPEPYDELLIKAWKEKQITDDELRRKNAELWGYADDMDFRRMVDGIHSACMVFRPIPEFLWEIDETKLKDEITAQLVEFKTKQSRTPHVEITE